MFERASGLPLGSASGEVAIPSRSQRGSRTPQHLQKGTAQSREGGLGTCWNSGKGDESLPGHSEKKDQKYALGLRGDWWLRDTVKPSERDEGSPRAQERDLRSPLGSDGAAVVLTEAQEMGTESPAIQRTAGTRKGLCVPLGITGPPLPRAPRACPAKTAPGSAPGRAPPAGLPPHAPEQGPLSPSCLGAAPAPAPQSSEP